MSYRYRPYRRSSSVPAPVVAFGAVLLLAAYGSSAARHPHGTAAPAEDAVAPLPAASDAVTTSGPVSSGPVVTAGLDMAAARGWTGAQAHCLNLLWTRESGWRIVWNMQGSGAYGIPQALPASKMASAGADYMTNPATEIRWGLGYIAGRYGDPCGAWNHETDKGWY